MEKLLDAMLGTLPSAVLALIPEHRKKQALERLQDLNPYSVIADNQDLVRVLRVAWVEAAEEVLDAGQKAARSPEWSEGQRANIDRFHQLAIKQLRAIRNACFDRRPAAGTTAIDAHLPLVIRGAAETVLSGAANGNGEAQAVTASFASTLAILAAGGDVREVPSVFVRIAVEGVAQSGGDARRSFGDLLFASFAEMLKDPNKHPQATTAFHMATQAVASALGERTLAALESIDSGLPALLAGQNALQLLVDGAAKTMQSIATVQQEQNAILSELLAFARKEGIYERARTEGISESAVRTIVERLGGEGLGKDDLIAWLNNWIEAARRELDRHSNESEAFEKARQEAERCFRDGRLTDASSAFMEEFSREEEEEAIRQEERLRLRIRLLEEAIRFDELALADDEVVVKLRKMAEVKGIIGCDALGVWLYNQAREFYKRGIQHAENAALIAAVSIYRSALKEQDHSRMPLQWAKTQDSLGLALQELAELEVGCTRLEQAIAAYNAALKVRTRELVPFEWAQTQVHLGCALAALGRRVAGTERLKEGVIALRSALQEFSLDRDPQAWIAAQMNLGNALRLLGNREEHRNILQESVSVYRAILGASSRESDPHFWSLVQYGLGLSLSDLGRREVANDRLEEAIAAHRAALEDRRREDNPHSWAVTQSALGSVLETLGRRKADNDLLIEAISVLRAALTVLTCDKAPIDWDFAQSNLADALWELGKREKGIKRLEEAVAAYEVTMNVMTRDLAPISWAINYGKQGGVLIFLAMRWQDLSTAGQALAQLQQAYDVLYEAEHPAADFCAKGIEIAQNLCALLSKPK